MMKEGKKYRCIKSWKGEEESENAIIQGRNYELVKIGSGYVSFVVEGNRILSMSNYDVEDFFDLNHKTTILKVKTWLETNYDVEDFFDLNHKTTILKVKTWLETKK